MSPGALTRRGLLLAVTAVSLYLLAPALIGVFGAFDELDDISPLWFVAMVALQVGSFACMWGILRLAVRTHRWRPVILSQLAANSFARIVPVTSAWSVTSPEPLIRPKFVPGWRIGYRLTWCRRQSSCWRSCR